MNFPQPTSLKYINDYVGLINKDVVEKIISIGKELEEKTTSELTVVIINTTEQLSVEEYANELFRNWGIGQKGKDNGVLLLVAIKDRVMRIEVGYGLEGAITDGETGRIRDECILPYLKKKDYSKGVYYGYIALAKEIEKEYNTKLKPVSDEEFEQEKRLELPEKIQLIVGSIIILVFLVFFIWAMIIAFDRVHSKCLTREN
ncbi:MAG: TPM domain-containing protein [Fervidobacterium sp.]|nr:TPM domain-containing protein [Fervidobacterium sp.]